MPDAALPPCVAPPSTQPARGRVDGGALFPRVDTRRKPLWVAVDATTTALHAHLVPGGTDGADATQEVLRLTILAGDSPCRFTVWSPVLDVIVDYDDDEKVLRFDAENDPAFWAEVSLAEITRMRAEACF